MIDRTTLDFLVFDWLDVGDLIGRAPYADQDEASVSAFFDLAARLAGDKFLNHYKESDRIEPHLGAEGVKVLPDIREGLRAYAEAGFFGAPFPETAGGLQVPETIHAAGLSIFMAANLATSAYAMLTIGNARLILAHGTTAQIDTFAHPQIAGEVLGTMCLSEPQAGSSLGDIRTRAVYETESPLGPRYRLTGNKMWISGGDHDITDNIFHLVLAKIPDAEGRMPVGTSGISLFLVPKLLVSPEGKTGERNDVVVAGLNHKMGYRGTSNCLLNFGEGTQFRPEGKAGAIGYLVGEPGSGLAIMFHMMNEARISVGLGAAAVAMRSHALSVDYARTRLQGRGPGSAKDASPDPLIVHPDVKRMLMAQKCYAEGALSLVLLCARLVDERHVAETPELQRAADLLLGLLTPVAKTWASEWGCTASDIAIQIHGGYGYTRDFDVEQLYRDNRLNPIHEGTTGIQGMDFAGRKLRRGGEAALDLLASRLTRTTTAAQADERLAANGVLLQSAWEEFRVVARKMADAPQPVILSHATELLQAFGHIVVAWIWLDQALLAKTRNHPLAEEKIAACDFFFRSELPRIHRPLALAAILSASIAEIPADIFRS